MSADTHRDQIIEMGVNGHRPAAVCQALGLTAGYVYRVFKEAREDGYSIPKHTPGSPKGFGADLGRLTTLVSLDQPAHVAAIDRAARKRGVSNRELIRQIVEAACDGMIDALLDDGVDDAD